ncbi:mechanosensitive ion channel [Iodobacter sp. CM08]|uniref:mechanosensitive ion channel family protein n=1 Tax=Iodobacter sp. CM08 TaxID=3085902 RepID=UPI0029826497|nr:mechanosensitive ion channel domain-containing protein [Iodobacter sp. CM08]MDW5417187.1 mechanosensitive ion channel [Iodobacter sp. CM08]
MNWIEILQAQAISYAPKLFSALLTLFIGWKLIGIATQLLEKMLARSNVESTLRHFLGSLANVALKALLLISAASMIGIETTSFIAILGAASLAIGLALQGSLSNFAGGVLILMFKPFKAGDYIEAQGQAGTVEGIQIFTTRLRTGDNKLIVVPNGPLANGNLTNYSAMPTRRVDFVFGIGYDDDIDHARQVILSVLNKDRRIHQDPAPMVVVSSLAESSVNFTVRVWSNSEHYWPIFFDTTENIKKAFDVAKISIPFPQRTVHHIQHTANTSGKPLPTSQLEHIE